MPTSINTIFFLKKINLVLSIISCAILLLSLYFYYVEITGKREIYFVSNEGDTSKLSYSNQTAKKMLEVVNAKR